MRPNIVSVSQKRASNIVTMIFERRRGLRSACFGPVGGQKMDIFIKILSNFKHVQPGQKCLFLVCNTMWRNMVTLKLTHPFIMVFAFLYKCPKCPFDIHIFWHHRSSCIIITLYFIWSSPFLKVKKWTFLPYLDVIYFVSIYDAGIIHAIY